MKNRGTVVFISVVLAIVSLYQLSFTWKTRSFENMAKKKCTVKGVFDSKMYKNFLDSAGQKPIYNLWLAKYNYFDCKQREISLGLDLQGGMSVILEVQKSDVVKSLAGANAAGDANFETAIKNADAVYKKTHGDYINIFADEFKKAAPGRKLATLFANNENKNLRMNASDAEVLAFIRKESDESIDRVFNVIEKRINQASVTNPNIQKLEGGLISVELPGVDNPRRIEKLLQESAKLEFWETYSNTEKNQFAGYTKILNKAYEVWKRKGKSGAADTFFNNTTTTDTSKGADTSGKTALAAKTDTGKTKKDTASKDDVFKDNPLVEMLQPVTDNKGSLQEGPVLGYVLKPNKEKVLAMLNHPDVRRVIPANVHFAFDAKSVSENSIAFGLYALKAGRNGKPVVPGDRNLISAASVNNGQRGIEISMSMNEEGTDLWRKATGSNVNEFVAIVLDDKVYSAPKVNEAINNGSSSITGGFDVREGQDLVNVLKAGKLAAPATIVASDVVGPSLGKEAIAKGLNSLLIGFLAVMVFMVLFYNHGGVISIIAVFANVFIIMAALSSLSGISLTLAGMAGILLTVGMAVDANVLIFERIKEEMHGGKSFKTAVSSGYKSAFTAIFDSNLTNIIAGSILLIASSGPVYGFAIVLVIGIISSMFTALMLTRLLIERRIDKGKEVKISVKWSENIFKNTKIDFISHRRKYYLISAVIIVAGISAFIANKGLPVGLDFKGGWSYQIQFENGKDLGVSEIKEALDKSLPGTSNEVKTIGTDNQFKIVTSYRFNDQGKETANEVEKAVLNAVRKFSLKGTDSSAVVAQTKVGATVAASTRNKSLIIVLVSFAAMFLYVVLRFKKIEYGIGATVAHIHDILIVLSIFALTQNIMPFPMDFDQHMIAALLTLIGYSMNDTVIVFDRIREYLSLNRHAKDDKEVINAAINQTLNRTIVTSSTVFLVMLSLFFLGGDVLKGFSFAMLIGVISGTYSSICIATPLVIDLRKKEKSKALDA